MFPYPREDLGGSNTCMTTLVLMLVSFRPLARIFWGNLTESYVELGGNGAMFPYPREV